MLNSLLRNAEIEIIAQLPLTEYSVEDIAKALIGLSEDKRLAVLDHFTPDKRTQILNYIE
jgi:hypothetical protein